MSSNHELIRLERDGWQALATSGKAAAAFYEENLAEDVLMLLPGGVVIADRAKVVASMRGDPWETFDIEEERVLRLGEEVAVVAYRATAVRHGREYTALFASTYMRENGVWKLVIHQQTPV